VGSNARHEADILPLEYNLRMLGKLLRFAKLHIMLSRTCGIVWLLQWLPFRPRSTLGWAPFFIGAIPAPIVGKWIGELIFDGARRTTEQLRADLRRSRLVDRDDGDEP
jgi:hypothetical protein